MRHAGFLWLVSAVLFFGCGRFGFSEESGVDSGIPDLGTLDSGSLDLDAGGSPVCGGGETGCTDDRDCDGIEDLADPWPDNCNPLEFVDTMNGASARWSVAGTLTYAGGSGFLAGRMSLSEPLSMDRLGFAQIDFLVDVETIPEGDGIEVAVEYPAGTTDCHSRRSNLGGMRLCGSFSCGCCSSSNLQQLQYITIPVDPWRESCKRLSSGLSAIDLSEAGPQEPWSLHFEAFGGPIEILEIRVYHPPIL